MAHRALACLDRCVTVAFMRNCKPAQLRQSSHLSPKPQDPPVLARRAIARSKGLLLWAPAGEVQKDPLIEKVRLQGSERN